MSDTRPVPAVDAVIDALVDPTGDPRERLRRAVKGDPRDIDTLEILDVNGDVVTYRRRVVEVHTGVINLATGEHRIDQ